jgi:hypothetical protein
VIECLKVFDHAGFFLRIRSQFGDRTLGIVEKDGDTTTLKCLMFEYK